MSEENLENKETLENKEETENKEEKDLTATEKELEQCK